MRLVQIYNVIDLIQIDQRPTDCDCITAVSSIMSRLRLRQKISDLCQWVYNISLYLFDYWLSLRVCLYPSLLSDLLLCVLPVGGSQLLLCLSLWLHCAVPAARWDEQQRDINLYLQQKRVVGEAQLQRRTDILFRFVSSSLRLGSSVAQLSVVPVRWRHTQEVTHLDTHTTPGDIQKVGNPCVCVCSKDSYQ